MYKVFICNNNKMKTISALRTYHRTIWLRFLKFGFCSGPKHPEVINFADVTDADVVLQTSKPRSGFDVLTGQRESSLKELMHMW